jgi:hypothetical protein
MEGMTEAQKQEAIAEMKRIYYRQYRKKNKEKIKEIHDRYWLGKAQEHVMEYRALNPDNTGEMNEA